MVSKNDVIVPDEMLVRKIYEFRGEKVMLDRDLAELYGVETKYLKRQVNRNIERFPIDFMFELTETEFEILRCQIGTSKHKSLEKSDLKASNTAENRGGSRYLPMVFTEQGIAMLSSVLNSPQAIQTNIRIMRFFTRMRKMILQHEELLKFIQIVEQKTDGNAKSIELLFEYMDVLMEQKEKNQSRKAIGFKTKKK
ncbi:MAG: ORF6N domain-containing protein [Bacteroidetes bacterium]|nr:ORF6N domain-containing protein [Bacteroidota bacterium]